MEGWLQASYLHSTQKQWKDSCVLSPPLTTVKSTLCIRHKLLCSRYVTVFNIVTLIFIAETTGFGMNPGVNKHVEI